MKEPIMHRNEEYVSGTVLREKNILAAMKHVLIMYRTGGVCIKHGASWTRKACSHEGCVNNEIDGGAVLDALVAQALLNQFTDMSQPLIASNPFVKSNVEHVIAFCSGK